MPRTQKATSTTARTQVAKAGAPAKKAAPAKAAVPAKKAAPAKTSVPGKKVAPAKAAASAKSTITAPTGTAPKSTTAPRSTTAPKGTTPLKGDGDVGRKRGPTPNGRERAAFLSRQRDLLLAERITYTSQAQELRAQADSLAFEHEPGDVQFDEEGGEGGTSNVDRELDLILSGQALAAVTEIDLALNRINWGTYGICEQCRNEIPEPRLEALPHASLCVACKSGGLSSRR